MVARLPDRRRSGFTLVELMIALAISCTVLVALGTLFVGSHRLMRQSYGVARASLDLRAEREHLLFHSNHEGGSAFWGGLLSASKVESLAKDGVLYTATGCDRNSGYPMSRNGQSYPNDLHSTVDSTAFGFANGDLLRDKGLYAVTLTRTVPNTGVTLSERVVVPVFGTAQTTESRHLFHDPEGGE